MTIILRGLTMSLGKTPLLLARENS